MRSIEFVLSARSTQTVSGVVDEDRIDFAEVRLIQQVSVAEAM